MATEKTITKGIIITGMKQVLQAKLKSEERWGRPVSWTQSGLVDETLRFLAEMKQLDPPNWVGKDYSGYYNQLVQGRKHPKLIAFLNEALHDLLIQGIVIPEISYPNFASTAEIYLTRFGEEWARSEKTPIPEDAEGMTDYLKVTVPSIDDVVLQYFNEALRSYERQLLFASAVMLGAAAEKIDYMLGESIIVSLAGDRRAEKVQDAMKQRNLHLLHERIMGILTESSKKKGPIPFEIHENSIDSLNALMAAIRNQRNSAVHPVVCAIDRPALRLLLLSFPQICKRAFYILSWLKDNRI